MGPEGLHYLPLSLASFLVLAGLFVLVGTLLAAQLLSFVSESLGIGLQPTIALLLLSLAGSYVNIPVTRLPGERVISGEVVESFGMEYVVPVVRDWPGTIVAVNLGGAVIPTLLSIYLLRRSRLAVEGATGVACVALVSHALAQPVAGVGIVLPVFVPALATALIARLLSRRHAAAVAYASGSLGTLIGADLLNLGALQGLGAPVASIGGAGTFDGIFVNGLMALVLASLGRRPGLNRRPPE